MVLLGCGLSNGTSGVTCSDPKQTKTWLLGEVDDSFETHPNGSFLFPIYNGTGHPVQLRVRSIGCSCYQVRRGATRLKVGDLFEIGSAATEELTLHPSRPTIDRAADYHFSLEYEPHPGAPPQIVNCHGTLVSVSEYRVNPSLLTAEFVRDSPDQTVHLEVTRSSREQHVAEQQPLLTGWPPGTQVEEPEALGPVEEDSGKLWRRKWRLAARIQRPGEMAFADESWPIRVSGPESHSPFTLARLMVQYRSGLIGPRIIHFGDVAVGKPVTRRIQILARDHREFRILGPSEPASTLSIRADLLESAKSHWGNVTFTPSAAGNFEAVLKIITDHPEQPSLEIEVRALVTL